MASPSLASSLKAAVNPIVRHTERAAGRFNDKVVVCSASSSGIGFSVVKQIAEEGGKVIFGSRKQKNVDKAEDELKSQGLEVAGIVSNQMQQEGQAEMLRFAKEKYGKIDCVFVSAGGNVHVGLPLTATEQEFDKIFKSNVTSTFHMIRQAVPYLKENGGGSIVTNSSIAALLPDTIAKPELAGLSIYAVCKLALMTMTRTAALSLAKDNIRVNCVAFGTIMTPFLLGMQRDTGTKDVGNTIVQYIHMKRAGLPDEVAPAVSFLLSDDSTYITGETLPVTGGCSAYRM